MSELTMTHDIHNKKFCPFVEKHRPSNFSDIVLDPINKTILKNIIETSNFPNLIFYGPPGTGKTTTIINLVNAYQKKLNNVNKGLMIHLNASDDRGIDIIRNQINAFVNSKPLFDNGMKFVILDEVDYMTKNAQQALRNLLRTCTKNVRFCLICNYISRIDEGLQTEFIRLRFNQLPQNEIIMLLRQICDIEKLNISNDNLNYIQKLYNSDIRSMINFIQTNQNLFNLNINFNIINNDVYKNLIDIIVLNNEDEYLTKCLTYIHDISVSYNTDKKNIMKNFINYIIRNKIEMVNSTFLTSMENVLHYPECKNSYYISYICCKLRSICFSQ
uniref:AAA+ ATPase domain-containing protein n=1 Tax=viral metagenome TaxID=1070528 RepID=A0A6C0E2U6_9ZZZZ